MKNFNLINSDEKKKMKDVEKTFITGYVWDKEEKKIEIRFANGKKYSYSYDEKVEQKILSRMEQQVIDASNNENVKKYEENGSACVPIVGLSIYLGLPISAIGYIISGSVMHANFASSDVAASIIAWSIALILGGASTVVPAYITKQIVEGIKEKKAFNDYKKSKFFLDNKDLMNHYSLQRGPILKGVSLKAKKQIEKAEGELNINNISKMSLRDLKKLKANIESLMEAEEYIKNIREELEQEMQAVKTK